MEGVMGCFLTVTEQDLNQLKNRMNASSSINTNHSKTNQTTVNNNTPSKAQEYLSTWMALYSVSPVVANLYKTRVMGHVNYEVGKAGEQIAEKVLDQEMGIKITQRTNSKGPDLLGKTRGQSEVAVEVKTTGNAKDFQEHLGEGYGYRQCSDPWLREVGVDPDNTRILGVLINTEKMTVSIYRRVDDDAKTWKNLVRDAPLSKYNLEE